MSSLSPAFRDALIPVLLALADDELVIGHRHSEWTGWAPHIEEDIAFSSIAQDEIGHSNLYFQLLADVTGKSPDEMALGRPPGDYRHAVVCERPNRDWAYTLARHFLYEAAERIRLESLTGSAYKPLADAATKILREERYHQMHADAWFRRLAHGPLEGRHQISLALSEGLPDSVGLFESTAEETAALENAILPDQMEGLLHAWLDTVVGRIEEMGLPIDLAGQEEGEFVPTSAGEMIEPAHAAGARPSIAKVNGRWVLEGAFEGLGGRHGRHSPDFDSLWDDLTKTYREDPAATW